MRINDYNELMEKIIRPMKELLSRLLKGKD